MGRKVRKQLNIDEAQDLALKREAERLGVSESEVVRRALEAWTSGALSEQREQPLAKLRAIQAKLDERWKQAGCPRVDYRFNRNDAYEDRLKRYEKL